jgi:hypothetical protein
MSEAHKAKTLEMIAVMQAYVDGKPIEAGTPACRPFALQDKPLWDWRLDSYRIATTQDTINWDHVSPEWKYMARDENGTVKLFKTSPSIPYAARAWWCQAGEKFTHANGFASYERGTVDWWGSLVTRPE